MKIAMEISFIYCGPTNFGDFTEFRENQPHFYCFLLITISEKTTINTLHTIQTIKKTAKLNLLLETLPT